MFRKARNLAVSLAAHEALFLTHDSFIDTTALQTEIPRDLVEAALTEPERNHGAIAPFLRTRIIEGVACHEVMEPDCRAKVLEG